MVVGVLIVVMIVAFALLVGIGGGSDDENEDSRSRRTDSETTRSSSTTSTTLRAPLTHTVQPGNTLTALALVFGVSKAAIIEANPNLNPDRLVEGQSLVIPSPLPVDFVIKPRKVEVGGSVRLKLTGAKEIEIVTFEFERPTAPFIGPPHEATRGGEVTTTYELGLADPPGTYTVTARGNQGTLVEATFRVEAAGR